MYYFIALIIILASIIGSKAIVFLWRLLGLPNFKKKVYFRDTYNRIKIYRGVNVCNYSKTAPDFIPWHTEKDYARLKQWGFNLVRFLVFWEAIEPEKGKYNFQYINKVKEHIAMLAKFDIDVIIDIHQDLYSRKFTGNGFPDWALPEKEYPFEPQRKWYLNYFQPAVTESYKHFWSNNELQVRYLSLVSFVYNTLALPKNVVGIDVMNEPFPNLPHIWKFERKTLSQLYQNLDTLSKANNYIRKLFFESWILTSTGISTYLRQKFFNGRNFHFPHYYPPFCHDQGKYNWLNKFLLKTALRSKAVEAKRLKSPAIIGEIGIYENVKDYLKFIEDFVSLSEKHQMSWIWYAYDRDTDSAQGLLDVNLEPKENLFKLLRIYPQRIAGKNPKYYTKDRVFCFECDYDVSAAGNTEIFTLPQQQLKIWSNVKYTTDKNILKFDCSTPGKTFIKIEF
jgi:endoglycosylceramidase